MRSNGRTAWTREALEPVDIDQALADMLGAGGRFAARMLGAQAAIGFADVT
jgi:hypothetical protein